MVNYHFFFFLSIYIKGNSLCDVLFTLLNNKSPSRICFVCICFKKSKFVPVRAHCHSEKGKKNPDSILPLKVWEMKSMYHYNLENGKLMRQ